MTDRPHPTLENQIKFVENMIKVAAQALFNAEPDGIAADRARWNILMLDNIKETLGRVLSERQAKHDPWKTTERDPA